MITLHVVLLMLVILLLLEKLVLRPCSHITKFRSTFYLKISVRYSVYYCVNGDRLNNGLNGFVTNYGLNNRLISLSKIRMHCNRIVPPTAVAVPGGLHQAPPPQQTPTPGAVPPPQTPPPLTESQTPEKTLPCPNFVAGGNNGLNLVVCEGSLMLCLR